MPVVHGLRWFGWLKTSQSPSSFPARARSPWAWDAMSTTTLPPRALSFRRLTKRLASRYRRLSSMDRRRTLRLTEHTQPAILTVSTAAERVLTEAMKPLGIAAKFAAGHSLGEYSAHVAAGTLSFADAVRAVRLRGRYMQQAVPAGEGAMAAILGLDPSLIATICEQVEDQLTPLPGDPAALNFVPGSAVVAPANLNSPAQTVISGAARAVEKAAELCKQAGAKRAVMLPVSAPFHCKLMQPAQESLAKDLAGLEFRDPVYPVAANVSARLITTGVVAREALVAQVTAGRALGGVHRAAGGAGSDAVHRGGAGTRVERAVEADSGQGCRPCAECGGFGKFGENGCGDERQLAARAIRHGLLAMLLRDSR